MTFKNCMNYDGRGNMCPKRPRCTELCEEAEAYVSQDHIGQGRSGLVLQQTPDPPPHPNNNDWIDSIAWAQGIFMPEARVDRSDMTEFIKSAVSSRQYRILIEHYVNGRSFEAIGNDIGCSRQAMRDAMNYAADRIKRHIRLRDKWNNHISDNLRKLTPKKQRIAFLRYHERMQCKDIIKMLKISRSALNYHLMKINEKLGL